MPSSKPISVVETEANCQYKKFWREGEAFIWLSGLGVALVLFMVATLVGVIVSNGMATFWPKALVSFEMKNGETFYPDQCMTRMEALRSYTINAAYAAFEEDIKGSLTPGKLADITVLSRDILTCPDDEILETEVLYTLVGGQILYEK